MDTPAPIRLLTPRDAPLLNALANAIGWQQTEAGAQATLTHCAGYAVGMEVNGELIASAMALVYGDCELAFVQQVIVREPWRRRGIATALLRHLLRLLHSCRTLRLYATAAGSGVYERLGFRSYAHLCRWRGAAFPTAAPTAAVAPMTPNDLTAVIEFDRVHFGVERAELLAGLYRDHAAEARVVRRAGRLAGFVLTRPGGHISTLQAATDSDAVALLGQVGTGATPSRRGSIDLVGEHPAVEDFLRRHGWEAWIPMQAMQYGEARPAPPGAYVAAAGADVG